MHRPKRYRRMTHRQRHLDGVSRYPPIPPPCAVAAVAPTTAAGAIDPNAALLQQHLQGLNVTITAEQADCMIDIAGGDVGIVVADVGVMSDLASQCGVDLTTMSG